MSSDPAPPRGMPILSGPPPITVGNTCRKCAKEFNALWRRGKPCGHCGFEYCSGCLEGSALMPRRARPSGTVAAGIRDAMRGSSSSSSSSSHSTGYDVEGVCGHCMTMLQVTAAPVQTLRSFPLKKLKDYLAAYDIPAIGVREKEDLVEAALSARNPETGTLHEPHEAYFRRKSVPSARKRNAPTPGPSTSTRPPPPRPQARAPPPRAAPQWTPPPPRPHYAPPPGAYPPPPHQRPPPPQPHTRPTPSPRPAATSPAPAPTPKAPVPTLMSLVPLPKSYLSSLGIGTLKAILYENHVRVDFSQVLEKSELVARVAELVQDERKRLERQRREEEREEREAAAARAGVTVPPVKAPSPNGNGNGNGAGTGSGSGDLIDLMGDEEGSGTGEGAEKEGEDAEAGTSLSTGEAELEPARTPTGPVADTDRGLCVVCQDEEATLAVVDCGHLALCAHCSDLVMATTRVCPMCRTRIVTPQRLIRIYRV